MGTDLPLLIVSFVVVLVPLIFVHELGHFIMGKLVGITILEFGIGFPPRARVIARRGDTEYTLNWLPFGGFVRPLGEDLVGPMSEEDARKDREALTRRSEASSRGVAVNDVSPLKRILFMAGGPMFNLLLAMALFTSTLLIGSPAVDHTDITVTGLAWDSPALRAGVRPGDIIRAVDGHPLDFTADLDEYLTAHAGEPVTLTVERGGTTFEVTVEAGDDLTQRTSDAGMVRISGVNENSPAEQAGVREGDIVLAARAELPYPVATLGLASVGDGVAPTARDLDYAPLHTHVDLRNYVVAWKGAPITFTVLRDGAPGQLTVEARRNPPPGEGATGTTIETRYPTTVIRESLPQAIVGGVERTMSLMGLVIAAPVMILRGDISGEQARPVGIVGISQLGGQFIQESVEVSSPTPFLNFAAAISVALGLTNLLPIPALDGGRILFVLIEVIRGKRMDPAREGMIHLIGIMFLLGLMFILIFADILNPVQLP